MGRYGFSGTGILLATLVASVFSPFIANGEEANATDKERKSEVRAPTQAGSDVTFSDVMGWVQRFGNRVGENISEATGKTATAIKSAVSDQDKDPESKESH